MAIRGRQLSCSLRWLDQTGIDRRGFDAVAEQVLADTGQLVGFTLDTLPHPQKGDHGLVEGDCGGWRRWFLIHSESTFRP